MSAKLIVLAWVVLFLPVGFAENLPKSFIVATDNAELFYLKNGEPDGLEHLPKGVQITAENQIGKRVFTTYNGKPAYIRSEFLVSSQEFAVATEKADTAAREQIAKAAAAKMERDIGVLRTHVLDQKNSHLVSDYDQTISLFRKFLTAYPGSPYDGEVNNRIAEWQAERDQVASGLIKHDGEWMTQAEFDKSHREDWVRTLLQDAGGFFKQKNWPDAARKYNTVLELRPGGGAEVVARRQLAASLEAWRNTITKSPEKMNQELMQAQGVVKSEQEILKRAQENMNNQSAVTLGDGKEVAQAMGDLMRAENQLKQIQAGAELSKSQLTEITQIANHTGIAARPELAPTVITASSPVESVDMMTQIADWFKQYWMIATGVALLGLFILSRILR